MGAVVGKPDKIDEKCPKMAFSAVLWVRPAKVPKMARNPELSRKNARFWRFLALHVHIRIYRTPRTRYLAPYSVE